MSQRVERVPEKAVWIAKRGTEVVATGASAREVFVALRQLGEQANGAVLFHTRETHKAS